jgi:uncharacterized membrane protein
MDYGLILARILHIVLGVLWVGSMFFMTVFLMPSLAEAGPDAAKVGAALTRRKLMIFLPIVALITMLSGLWLYWRVSLGFAPEYMRSGPGQTYGIGAALAIIAFILGVAITRPAMMKSMRLAQSAMSASPPERDAMMAEAQALRARGASAGRVILSLLMGAAIAMSIGRYV